jgi:hypothetical protein
MNPNHQQLIDIIKCALNQTIYQENVSHDIFVIAKENGISGTVFIALDKSIVDETVYTLFKEEYYQYIKKDQIQVAVLDELRKIFNLEGIDYIFLKGSFLKTIYPESYMRSMGDIDVLVKPDQMKNIRSIMEKNGFKNWVNSDHHDCYLKYKNVDIEIHPKLFSGLKGDYQKLFDKPWENTVQISDYEYQFKDEYNFLYQINHMIKHMYSSGVGFRTIIDLYMFLSRHDKTFNIDILNDYFDNFSNKLFIYNLIVYINHIFSENILSDISKYGKMTKINIDQFTSFLFVSGIHGIGEKHNLFVGGFAKYKKEHRNIFIGKLKFLLAMIFLPYRQMKEMYPFINKSKLLLPIAWLFRIMKSIFKKRSRTIRKLKRFSISNDEVLEVEKLFNNIGL